MSSPDVSSRSAAPHTDTPHTDTPAAEVSCGPARPAVRRIAVIGVVCAAALVGAVGTASAHVTAQPGTAAQGTYTAVAFRTPNEEDKADTVKLEVSFPTDHPIASVSVEPVPGWTATVQKSTLATPIQTDDGTVTQAVSKITWSGGKIMPGQYQDFSVSLGPLPTDTDKLVFKALQTYDNGEVVRWIENAPPGGPEPEHPAPTLTLTKAPDAAATTPAGTSTSGGAAALTLGIIGTVLGLIGAVLGGLALRRRTPGGETGDGTPAS